MIELLVAFSVSTEPTQREALIFSLFEPRAARCGIKADEHDILFDDLTQRYVAKVDRAGRWLTVPQLECVRQLDGWETIYFEFVDNFQQEQFRDYVGAAEKIEFRMRAYDWLASEGLLEQIRVPELPEDYVGFLRHTESVCAAPANVLEFASFKFVTYSQPVSQTLQRLDAGKMTCIRNVIAFAGRTIGLEFGFVGNEATVDE